MKSILKITILFALLPLSTAFAQLSHSEGALSVGHDRSLQAYRDEYFYNADGRLSVVKLQKLKSFLTVQRDQLAESARLNKKTNLIFLHNYDAARADKQGLEAMSKEAEALAPLIFALEEVERLLQNHATYSATELHERVEITLLWLATGYTIYPRGVFTSFNNRIRNLQENFFDFKKDESGQVQASNLLQKGAAGTRFLTQDQIQAMRTQGQDISRLDPPSSAFWTNNVVEDYNPESEIYFNQQLFPPREVEVPVFRYKRMGSGTIKFKTEWTDTKELNKNGEPKKKDVTLRVGWESYTASVVNHLARLVGYPANSTAFRKKVKLELGDTKFETFLVQWKKIHTLEMGSAISYIERIPGENAIYLKDVTLEAYPDEDEYRRISPFRMGDNGLRNRREYRAMVLYNGLISLQDHFEYQSRVDAYRDPQTKEWRPFFFISDTSSALGLPAVLGHKGTVNEFTWEFTKILNDKVYLNWLSVFDYRAWKDATYSDVKWMARRMARIKSSQIDQIMATSGFPEPVKALYREKLKTRLNQMIRDFDLEREGFRFHEASSKAQLAQMYPGQINEKGLLKERAQEIPNTTLPILGNDFTYYQRAVVKGINAIQRKLLEAVTKEAEHQDYRSFDGGSLQTNEGLLMGARREVVVNRETGPNQKRYLLKDTLSVSVPVGVNSEMVTTPVVLYYTYSFTYVHSVSTMLETGRSRFFSLVNPFSIHQIRRNLGLGEQLFVSHRVGAGIGKVKLKASDHLSAQIALLAVSGDKVQELYFSKTSDDILEVTSRRESQRILSQGIDVRAAARFGIWNSTHKINSEYDLYRLDLLNKSEADQERMHSAFQKALVENDFTKLKEQVRPLKMNEQATLNRFNFSFFIWHYSRDRDVQELKLDSGRVFVAREATSFDRATDRILNDKVKADPASDAALDYVGEYWNEGENFDFSVEAKARPDLSGFEEMQAVLLFNKLDNYATKKEFEKDFKTFFNKRMADTQYLQFKMPNGLEAYPELSGQMRWQLSHRSILALLGAAQDYKNLPHLEPKDLYSDVRELVDPRETVALRARQALQKLAAPLNEAERSKILKQRVRDILFVIKSLIGEKGERVGTILNHVQKKDVWVLTSIRNMLDLSHSSFRTSKTELFWAPEIGQYPGQSYLTRFRENTLIRPIFLD